MSLPYPETAALTSTRLANAVCVLRLLSHGLSTQGVAELELLLATHISLN
jgi:hypothetical protein